MKFGLKTLFIVTTVWAVIFTVIGYRVRKARQDYTNVQKIRIVKNLQQTLNGITHQINPVRYYPNVYFIPKDDNQRLTAKTRCGFLEIRSPYRQMTNIDSIGFTNNMLYNNISHSYIILNERNKSVEYPYAIGKRKYANNTEYFVQFPFKPYQYCFTGEYK